MQVERGPLFGVGSSGERVSNTWATCPWLWDNSKKLGLIPDMTADRMVWWWGKCLPRGRTVAGLRGGPGTLGLRHGPGSYGRQEWGILRNGRKADGATAGWG